MSTVCGIEFLYTRSHIFCSTLQGIIGDIPSIFISAGQVHHRRDEDALPHIIGSSPFSLPSELWRRSYIEQILSNIDLTDGQLFCLTG